MEKYTAAFDRAVGQHAIPSTAAWYTSDCTYQAPNGQRLSGRQACLAGLETDYHGFAGMVHEPVGLIISEVVIGVYELQGEAEVYADLLVPAADGVKPFMDSSGRRWDVKMPAMFNFRMVEFNSGGACGYFKMSSSKVCADMSGAIFQMVKRGMITM